MKAMIGILSYVEKASSFLNQVCLAVARIFFAISFTVLLVQVFLRNVPFLSSVFWAEELARYLMIYIAMLGLSSVAYIDEHSRVETILAKMSPKAVNIWEYCRNILEIIFLGCLMYYGMRTVGRNLTTLTAGLRWPWGYAYFAVPLGCGLMIIQTLFSMLKRFGENSQGIWKNKYEFFLDKKNVTKLL